MGLSTTYTKVETDYLLQRLEQKTSDKYNDKYNSIANDIIKFIDINTGENVNYRETTTWYDGSSIDDAKTDGNIYKKIENKYFVDTRFLFDKTINLSMFNFDFLKALNFANGKGEIKLIINRTINLQGNSFVIPKNVFLEFSPNAKIQHGIIDLGGCKLVDTYQQIFENCEISGNFYDYKGRAEWFGAKNDLSNDCLSAFNQVVKIANKIILSGKYKFSDTWEIIDKQGYSIEGEFNQNITFTENKEDFKILLDFDDVPIDHNGLKINGFVGVTLKDFAVSYNRSTKGGTSPTSNAALRLFKGHDFKISGLRINATHSSNTAGIILGNNTGELCAFLGFVEDVKVLCHLGSIGIGTFGGNTSLNFRSCYVAGGGYWHIEGTVYSSFLNCACDGAKDYAYLITSNVDYNSTNLSFISCGSESCGKTGFWISDYVQNIDFLNPYEANNNTLGGSGDGTLFTLNPTTWCKNIKITNPSSYSNNGIYSLVFQGQIDNIFVESTNKKNVRKGFGGGSLNKVSITGDYEMTAFTPTIEDSTVTSINDIKAFWKKTGDGFEIFIIIDGDFTTTSGSSYIKLPFNIGRGISNIVQLNGYAKPQMLIDGDKIWLPSMDIDTNAPITITGKAVLYQKTILGI